MVLTACSASPTGSNGSNGANGGAGSSGASGANGSSGSNGSDGTNGGNGGDGSNGSNGSDGSNGANGLNSLVNIVDAGPTVDCAHGALTVQSGIDLDASGVLDANEVTSTQSVCKAPSSPEVTLGDVSPPVGTSGTSLIDAHGGNSRGNSAGTNGGNVAISINTRSNGHVKLFSTGDAAAEAALPVFPAPPTDFGSNPLVVAAGITSVLAVNDTQPITVAHDSYFTVKDRGAPTPIFKSVNGIAVHVTGINVIGGELRFELNDIDNNKVTVAVPGNIFVAGTLKQKDAVGTGMRVVAGGDVYVSTTGKIINDDRNLTVVATGNVVVVGSGRLEVGTGKLTVESQRASVYNGGVYDAASVANGGTIDVEAALGFYNSGTLSANGTAVAGSVSIKVTGESNNGGEMKFRNTGTIRANGGSCMVNGCIAGRAGAVSITVFGGPLQAPGYVAIANSGELAAIGGSSTGTTAGNAGLGGSVTLLSKWQSGDGRLGNVATVAGSIVLSGHIRCNSGDGLWAALTPPGNISIAIDPGVANGQEIILRGYAGINTNGGSILSTQNAQAGDAGNIRISNQAGGGVINYVEMTASGGDFGTGDSTELKGGDIDLSAGFGGPAVEVSPREVVINKAKLTAKAGAGTTNNDNGGKGGRCRLTGAAGVTNSAVLDATGGRGFDIGGDAGTLALSSGGGPVNNTGGLDARGGATTSGFGGRGGGIGLFGTTVTTSGNMRINGGNSSANGGDGGYVVMLSTAGTTTSTSSYIKGGGSGASSSANGTVYIDNQWITQ